MEAGTAQGLPQVELMTIFLHPTEGGELQGVTLERPSPQLARGGELSQAHQSPAKKPDTGM